MASLAPVISATGITAPSYDQILASLQASYTSIYGTDTILDPSTQDGQLLAVFAQAIYDTNQVAIAIYNGFSPATAQGAQLSSLVKINGVTRKIPTNSTVVVTIVGQAGTVITNGVVGDSINLDTRWDLPVTVTIPLSGTINVLATNEVAGAVAAGPGTITQILTPTLGWQSVTNAASAVPGAAIETDAALRDRQRASTAVAAQSILDSIYSAIAALTGVGRLSIEENSTSATNVDGVPGHSIAVVVEMLGVTTTAVATAIANTKTPGTGTYGTTSVSIVDANGIPNTINFFQLTYQQVYVSVTVKSLPGFTAAVITEIISDLVAYINSLPISGTVYYNKLIAIAELPGDPMTTTFNVTALTVGIAPGPVGTTDLLVGFGKVAQTVNANITVTVT